MKPAVSPLVRVRNTALIGKVATRTAIPRRRASRSMAAFPLGSHFPYVSTVSLFTLTDPHRRREPFSSRSARRRRVMSER
jgi:hypothetical protein